MVQRFGAESQQEDAMNPAFPYNGIFHDSPEGQSRSSPGKANDGGHGYPSLTGIGGSGLGPFHSNYSVDPALLHQQPSHPSSIVGPSQYRSALIAAPDTLLQGPPQAGSSAAEAKGSNITENSLNAYSKLPPLAPVWPSSSDIVRRRSPTQRRSHASGSAVDQSDPQHTFHFSSSISVRGGQYNATSVVEHPQRRRGRLASQRLPPSSIAAPATSASLRFQPYAASGVYIEARHVQSSLASLSSPEPVGLQSAPSQNGQLKLSLKEHGTRSELLRNEVWFKNQTEESLVTAADEFVKREYISAADKTRFSAFVWVDLRARRAVCRIPHDIIVKDGSVPCTYKRENVKEAVAHVSEVFGYKGYKCQSTALGHRCDKRFPTRERRNDHYSKVTRGPDPSSACNKCGKSVTERNMERHTRICKGKTEIESQPK